MKKHVITNVVSVAVVFISLTAYASMFEFSLHMRSLTANLTSVESVTMGHGLLADGFGKMKNMFFRLSDRVTYRHDVDTEAEPRMSGCPLLSWE